MADYWHGSWYQEGYDAGLAGETTFPDWLQSIAQRRRYLRGFTDGRQWRKLVERYQGVEAPSLAPGSPCQRCAFAHVCAIANAECPLYQSWLESGSYLPFATRRPVVKKTA